MIILGPNKTSNHIYQCRVRLFWFWSCGSDFESRPYPTWAPGWESILRKNQNNNDDPSTSALGIRSACSGSHFEKSDNPNDSTCPSTQSMNVSAAHSSSSTTATNNVMMIIKVKRIVLIKSMVRLHTNNRLFYPLRNGSHWWACENTNSCFLNRIL